MFSKIKLFMKSKLRREVPTEFLISKGLRVGKILKGWIIVL